ncbi:MAG: hypothetical protein FVQ85_02950 [Planctomycetes bacterium]|nr:hypothetical protein [Planctomycetota bacterium]
MKKSTTKFIIGIVIIFIAGCTTEQKFKSVVITEKGEVEIKTEERGEFPWPHYSYPFNNCNY